MAKIYSHSRLSTFEQCAYKFKLKYLDKIIPDIEMSIESHLGKCVHDSLEWLYNYIKENKDLKKIPTIDAVIEYYANKWQENYNENIKIVKSQFTSKDYFNKGVQFLVDYYMKHQPFQDGTIECEKKIMINLDDNYQIQGFIDRLVQDLGNGNYEIHDYKTANALPSQEKIDNDRQLALYSIAIKEIFGHDKEIKLVWHYLAHNTKIISSRTNEQLQKLKEETIRLINKIEETAQFPSRKSVLCHWCEYKSMCHEFGGKINEKQKKLDIISCNKDDSLFTDDKLIEEEINLDIF